jgi:hypothetical protein
MRSVAIALALFCVAMAAPAWCQSGGAGTGVIDAPNGDPFWIPTDKQLQRWTSEGIDVARLDGLIVDAPGVKNWMWWRNEGTPCGDGSSLVGVVLLAPRPAVTAAGYWSAWDGQTWDRIQLNQDSAALDIAQNVRYDLFGSQVDIVLGVMSEEGAGSDQVAAVWCNGEWRPLAMTGGCAASSLLDGRRFGEQGWRWLGGYLLAKALDGGGELDLEQVWVVTGSIPLHPRVGPDEALTSAVPAPSGGYMRVAIGLPEEFAYVDF